MHMADFKAEDHRLTNPDYSRPGNESRQLIPEPRGVQGVVSFLSSNERQGPWELPRRFRALAVLGNVELDLRGAEIGYGLSVIEAAVGRSLLGRRVAAGVHDGALAGGLVNQQVGIFGKCVEGKPDDSHTKWGS